jgi:lipopolysaccharide export system protein LptC
MHKRTAHRWRLTAIMVVGTFFAFGTFWLVQLAQNGDTSVDPNSFKNEPDYIVEQFSFVRMTPEGKPRYLVSGAKLTHRPIDDTSDVELPVLQGVAPGQPVTTITSQRARIRHAQNQADLLGDVNVVRPESPTNRAMQLKTEALTVYTDEDRMTSDQPVQVTLGNSTIKGTGMEANNATGELKFASRGQIVYPPRAARVAPTTTGKPQ